MNEDADCAARTAARATALPAGLDALLVVALLALALAACAPTASGGVTRADHLPDATHVVPAGSVLYVVVDVPLEETEISVDRVRRAEFTWIPLGIRGESANASRLVNFPPPEAPEDWQVRLWQTRILRERPLGEPEGSFAYRVEAELRVDVPASAEGLVRRIRGELRFADGATLPLDFLVRVE